MVDRFMLNTGAIETATRVIIHNIEGKDSAPIFSGDLSARISFIRMRDSLVKITSVTNGP